jgi:ribose transport system permease protein
MTTVPVRGARKSLAKLDLNRFPWFWSAIGALILWILVSSIAHRGIVGSLQSTVHTGSFLVLAGLGQLFVMTTGVGNIDLSIPNVMTLSSFVAFSVAGGHNSGALVGVLVGLAVGLAVGIINAFAIYAVGIPPIVATLAVGLIVQSAILLRASKVTEEPPSALVSIASDKLGGVPVVAIGTAVITIIAAIILQRGVFGRAILAVGQSSGASYRAGIARMRASVSVYLISGVLAALSGIFLGAFSGPSISLGSPYLLTSIAVVVLGGTLISGGQSTITGLWTAMLMLSYIITVVYVLHWSVAIQNIFEGLVIVLVLILAGGERRPS